MSEPHACSFNRDQRCLKGAGCAAHGIECMRKGAALSFSMGPRSVDTHTSPNAREAALEEAAKVCEDVKNNGPVVTSTCWHAVASQLDHAAKRIRSLSTSSGE